MSGARIVPDASERAEKATPNPRSAERSAHGTRRENASATVSSGDDIGASPEGTAASLTFITGNHPAEFKSKLSMTTVRKAAMDAYLKGDGTTRKKSSKAAAPTQRAYAQIPCDACRRRKSRCVVHLGAVVCVFCELHKQECTFKQPPMPLKRKAAESDEKSSVETFITMLESRWNLEHDGSRIEEANQVYAQIRQFFYAARPKLDEAIALFEATAPTCDKDERALLLSDILQHLWTFVAESITSGQDQDVAESSVSKEGSLTLFGRSSTRHTSKDISLESGGKTDKPETHDPIPASSLVQAVEFRGSSSPPPETNTCSFLDPSPEDSHAGLRCDCPGFTPESNSGSCTCGHQSAHHKAKPDWPTVFFLGSNQSIVNGFVYSETLDPDAYFDPLRTPPYQSQDGHDASMTSDGSSWFPETKPVDLEAKPTTTSMLQAALDSSKSANLKRDRIAPARDMRPLTTHQMPIKRRKLNSVYDSDNGSRPSSDSMPQSLSIITENTAPKVLTLSSVAELIASHPRPQALFAEQSDPREPSIREDLINSAVGSERRDSETTQVNHQSDADVQNAPLFTFTNPNFDSAKSRGIRQCLYNVTSAASSVPAKLVKSTQRQDRQQDFTTPLVQPGTSPSIINTATVSTADEKTPAATDRPMVIEHSKVPTTVSLGPKILSSIPQLGKSPHQPGRELDLLENFDFDSFLHTGDDTAKEPDQTTSTAATDYAKRRRIQNRIAQRNYRKKLKTKLEDLERRAEAELGVNKLEDDATENIIDPEVLSYQNADETVVIQCVCENTNDRRFIIPCVTCGTWQHISCYYELAQDVVENHECAQCNARDWYDREQQKTKRPDHEVWLDTTSTATESSKRPKTAGAESSVGQPGYADSLLTLRSNYQNILDGKANLVSYYPTMPASLQSNLTSKRTSHKMAEQGRRNRINIALQDMQALLPPSRKQHIENSTPAGTGFAGSKASTVESAIEHIKDLQRQIEEKDKLLKAHVSCIERLKQESKESAQIESWPREDHPELEDRWNRGEDKNDKMISADSARYVRRPLDSSNGQQNQIEGEDIMELPVADLNCFEVDKNDEKVRQTGSEILGIAANECEAQSKIAHQDTSSLHVNSIHPRKSSNDDFSPYILKNFHEHLEADWAVVHNLLPEPWKWDVEYQIDCWTCTPLEPDVLKLYPLKIAHAPVVIPVEYQWPPMGGVNPPPDPRPSTPIDPRTELSIDGVRDLFLTFESSIGFYLLINGLLQVIVPKSFDTLWASSHLPHKYAGLKVCYIPQTIEPTMQPSATETTKTELKLAQQHSGLSSIFRQSRVSTGSSHAALKLNDFIEARPKANHRKEKFSGRIGLKVAKGGESYLIMSTHIITEAMLAKSHREAIFGRGRDRFEKLEDDWNEHVDIWAGNERLGTIHKSFDMDAEIYPNGFHHDVTLIKPTSPSSVKNIISPMSDLGWLNRDSWSSLRQRTSVVKILGPTENQRSAKSIICSRPSEILVVGEGIFLNQTAAANSSKHLKDHDMSTWKNLISRAMLYRMHPDFDPPTGYSGVALYADGIREDGTAGPGIAGFQSFVQRSGHVQNYNMEGPALDRRLQLGRVAFYGAFEVPEELRREYTVV